MIGDVIRMTASFLSGSGELRQWVWHYIQTVGGSSDYFDLAAAVLVRLVAAWSDVEGDVVATTQGTTLDLALYDTVLNQWDTLASVDSSALIGLSLNPVSPGNVSPFVTFFTDVGRSRGKKKFFDIAESLMAGDVLNVGLIADLASFAAVLDNALTDGGNTWRPGNYNSALEVFNQWNGTTVGVGAISGSQYQRLTGRGI